MAAQDGTSFPSLFDGSLVAPIERHGVTPLAVDGDATPPDAVVVSPAVGAIAGSFSDARFTPFVIDVTDNVALAYVAVYASVKASERLLVYRQGMFEPGFSVGFRENITGGVRLHVVRNEGWPAGAVSLIVDAVDTAGNGTSKTLVWVVPSESVVQGTAISADVTYDHVDAALARLCQQFQERIDT